MHPEACQAIHGRYHRAFTRRFPFAVVYRIAGETVQVLGVLPTRADPTVASLLLDIRST